MEEGKGAMVVTFEYGDQEIIVIENRLSACLVWGTKHSDARARPLE